MSLVSLAMTLLMFAHFLGLLPNERESIVRGRIHLCESIAVNFSMLAEHANVDSIEEALNAVANRNDDIQSIGVRSSDGEILFQIGPHEETWVVSPDNTSTETHMFVPVARAGENWGTVEISFTPIGTMGMTGLLGHPIIALTAFFGVSGLLVFYIFLSIVLKQLNPSNVVPGRVKSALDTLVEGLLVLDKQGRIVLANEAFLTTCGKNQDELMGRNAADLKWVGRNEDGDGAPLETLPWEQVLNDGEPQRGTLMGLEANQEATFVVNASPVFDDKGKRRGVISSFDDITELHESKKELVEKRKKQDELMDDLKVSTKKTIKQNKELERLATRDGLTGCFNRRSFFDHFETAWTEAIRHNAPLSCVMVDVDHFKKINDNHGHTVGDEVLKAVANCLANTVREFDVLARYGGEEFVVIMPKTVIAVAGDVADQLRSALESLKFEQISITASFGVSALSASPTCPQEMLEQADQCLYIAKRNGRNQVVRFDQVTDEMLESDGDLDRGNQSENSQPIPYPAVTALVSALAFRDKATASHSRRVADLCIAVGQGMMALKSCYVLETAAMLHDIGKIGIPDSILLKPGELTSQEWELMRRHDRIGKEIIRSSFRSQELSDIVENYRRDYSDAIEKKESIPLGARILSIADAYDSMTSKKPYRSQRTSEEACEELRRCAGTQFDPQIVERFIEAIQIEQRQSHTKLTVNKELAIGIGVEMEQLAIAVDRQDMVALRLIASRLAKSAKECHAPEVEAKAIELERTTSQGEDLLGILRSASELHEYCRAAQASLIQ